MRIRKRSSDPGDLAEVIYNVLLCLGDSLTAGARDRYLRNYPLELAAQLSARTGEEYYCITEAVNGRTSAELARDAYKIVTAYPDTRGVLLLIGTNDSRDGIPVELYRDNVTQIVRACRILGKKVFVLSVPKIDSRNYLWYGHTCHQLINEYNRVLEALPHVFFVDIRDVIGHAELIDGVHFSHEANVRLAEALAERLYRSTVENAPRALEQLSINGAAR
jgi:lysophospholipase L1-like esterase